MGGPVAWRRPKVPPTACRRPETHGLRRTVLETTAPQTVVRPIIGLLGGIGAGKTHVAHRLAALGPARVVDADGLAHVALEALAADGRLVEAFGPDVVRDGKPDRRAIAKVVFQNTGLLRRLERLVHPSVQTAIRMTIEDHRSGAGPRVLVLDVPLLIEVGLDRRCDALWYIDVPTEVRLERAKTRGLDEDELKRRTAFQSPLERKRARADHIIDNHVDDGALDEQILTGLARLGVVTSAVASPSNTSAASATTARGGGTV